MRYLFGFLCVCALGVMPLVGCDDDPEVRCEMDVCPCSEQGIRAAVAAGGGPYTFACDGPTTVVTKAEIVIDKPVSLDGGGLLTLDGNESHRLFWVTDGTSLELSRFVVRRGVAKQGGGIHNEGRLWLRDSVLSDNVGDDGGGIWSDADLTIERSMVWNNSAVQGGGVWSDGSLSVEASTVSGNSARVVDGWGARGGGIFARSVWLLDSAVSGNAIIHGTGGGIDAGTVFMANSTVSGNWGDSATAMSATNVTMVNSTVSGNSVEFGGASIDSARLILISSTIWHGGSPLESWSAGILVSMNSLLQGPCEVDLASSGGNNVESPGNTCGFDPDGTDQVNVSADDLKLGELADNGGPTMTHALGAGSVAIDQIPAADCVDADGAVLIEDQRGQPRPAGAESKCDVGAFERQPED